MHGHGNLKHVTLDFTNAGTYANLHFSFYLKIVIYKPECGPDKLQHVSCLYSLTPWCRVLLEKLTGLQLDNKFPAFHGTPRLIIALTSVRHLSLSWASPIQSIYSHPTSWRSILISSTHLRLGLPSGLFTSSFPIKTLHTPLSSPIRAKCPAHLILLDFITRTIMGEELYFAYSKPIYSCVRSRFHRLLVVGNETGRRPS